MRCGGPVELRVINHNGSYNVVVYGYAGRNLRELGFADLAQAQSRSVEMARGWFDAVPTS